MILESVFLRFLFCVICTIITESPPPSPSFSWEGGRREEYKAIIIISILMAIRVDEMYFFKALTIRKKKFLIHFYYHKVLKTYSNNRKQN